MSWWKCKNINDPKNRLQFICVKLCNLQPQRLETMYNFFQLLISNTGICKRNHLLRVIQQISCELSLIRRHLCDACVSGDVWHCKSHPYPLNCALAGSCICRLYGWFYSCSQIWIFIFLMICLFIFPENNHAVLWNVFNCCCHK